LLGPDTAFSQHRRVTVQTIRRLDYDLFNRVPIDILKAKLKPQGIEQRRIPYPLVLAAAQLAEHEPASCPWPSQDSDDRLGPTGAQSHCNRAQEVLNLQSSIRIRFIMAENRCGSRFAKHAAPNLFQLCRRERPYAGQAFPVLYFRYQEKTFPGNRRS
jgi:hypothetical protein